METTELILEIQSLQELMKIGIGCLGFIAGLLIISLFGKAWSKNG